MLKEGASQLVPAMQKDEDDEEVIRLSIESKKCDCEPSILLVAD